MCTLKAEQRKPQLQPVGLTPHTAECGERMISFLSRRSSLESVRASRGRIARHSLTRGPALWHVQYHGPSDISPLG